MPASPPDQQSDLQVDAFTAAGCYRVFTEAASGARADRPILERVQVVALASDVDISRTPWTSSTRY
jgi:hypothetical protein